MDRPRRTIRPPKPLYVPDENIKFADDLSCDESGLDSSCDDASVVTDDDAGEDEFGEMKVAGEASDTNGDGDDSSDLSVDTISVDEEEEEAAVAAQAVGPPRQKRARLSDEDGDQADEYEEDGFVVNDAASLGVASDVSGEESDVVDSEEDTGSEEDVGPKGEDEWDSDAEESSDGEDTSMSDVSAASGEDEDFIAPEELPSEGLIITEEEDAHSEEDHD